LASLFIAFLKRPAAFEREAESNERVEEMRHHMIIDRVGKA
jgi:hypothetical protein